MSTATYTRGTTTHKVTSTSVPAGTVLLTVQAGEHILVAASKTGAELRTVASTERVAPGAYERNSRIVVHFTDGTVSTRCAPSQTWMAVTNGEPVPFFAPAEEPTPVATEAPAAVEAPAAPAAEETTKAYRIGKLLREYVLANAAASESELAAHIASRNVCYDGTATLRVTARWAEQLINLASDMDAEHKAAARAARRTLYALFA